MIISINKLFLTWLEQAMHHFLLVTDKVTRKEFLCWNRNSKVKAEMLLFSNSQLRGPPGGPRLGYFDLKQLNIFGKKPEKQKFQIKIASPGAPWGPPEFRIWKKQHLSFHWKKNHAFIFFRSNFKSESVFDFEFQEFKVIGKRRKKKLDHYFCYKSMIEMLTVTDAYHRPTYQGLNFTLV